MVLAGIGKEGKTKEMVKDREGKMVGVYVCMYVYMYVCMRDKCNCSVRMGSQPPAEGPRSIAS